MLVSRLCKLSPPAIPRSSCRGKFARAQDISLNVRDEAFFFQCGAQYLQTGLAAYGERAWSQAAQIQGPQFRRGEDFVGDGLAADL